MKFKALFVLLSFSSFALRAELFSVEQVEQAKQTASVFSRELAPLLTDQSREKIVTTLKKVVHTLEEAIKKDPEQVKEPLTELIMILEDLLKNYSERVSQDISLSGITAQDLQDNPEAVMAIVSEMIKILDNQI